MSGRLPALAEELRNEAAALLAQSGIENKLRAHFGEVAVVGSAALDLMTWRDLDLYVIAEVEDKADFLGILPELDRGLAAAGHTLLKAVFNDEWALPRGDYGSGYYWGLRARAPAGQVWKLDIWAWNRDTFAQKLRELDQLRQSLSQLDRALILRLKSEVQTLPEFRKDITSMDVYRFLIAGRGTSLEELRDFAAASRPPGASPPAAR